jgi:putative membrane protein
VVGVAVNIASAHRHVRLVQELNHGGSGYRRPSSLAIAVAAILAAIGLAMAIYLISIREPLP